MENKDLLFNSLQKLDNWLVRNEWKAYDPFDGLNSKGLSTLTFNNHYLRIILQQSVRRFPLNLRPILGIKRETSSKGMGYCGLAYLKLYQATQKGEYLNKLRNCLDWLIDNFSQGYSGYSWGNHFSYESRGGKIPLDLPTIVWTSLIANTFLDAFEYLNELKYFDVAMSAGKFIINDIGRHKDSDKSICFMYTPQNSHKPSVDGCIHNSNVLGGWLLARLYQHTKDSKLLSLAKESIEYTVKYQLPDGGWYYGEPLKFRWVDSFHTGYVLESIYGYTKATGDMEYSDKLKKGFRYFKSTFFKKDGTPNYYNYKTYPIDIQCASQGIQTLVNLREYDPSALELAEKVARWTTKHMQDSKGYFYFRKYPFITNKTPMFHWGQATMLAALSVLFKVIKENNGTT